MHCVDLGESFQTHIHLQNLASIQPRTSPVKFARPDLAADRLEGVLRAGDAGAPDEDGLLGEGGGRHRAGRESQGEEGLGSFKTLAW